jgi:drug/metabolite transporter (DMT)-like permease
MIVILLAVIAAIGWGAADYFGGDASRADTPVFVIVAVTEFLGTLAVVPVLLARGTLPPDNPRLLFSVLAGVAVTVELGLIYRAISLGNAFVTAPVGALGTAIAVGVGLIGGDPLSVTVAAGLVLAVVGGGASAWVSPKANASTTVSQTTGSSTTGSSTTGLPGSGAWRTAATCVAAAAAVAVMLSSLHAAGQVDPYWATGIEHLSTTLSAGIAALIGTRGRLRQHLPGRPELPKLGLVALLGAGGDLAYTTASGSGALTIVSAISSLYPIPTITLGLLLAGQRTTRTQSFGIALALLGAAILGTVTH